jgi:hypothetical protein
LDGGGGGGDSQDVALKMEESLLTDFAGAMAFVHPFKEKSKSTG